MSPESDRLSRQPSVSPFFRMSDLWTPAAVLRFRADSVRRAQRIPDHLLRLQDKRAIPLLFSNRWWHPAGSPRCPYPATSWSWYIIHLIPQDCSSSDPAVPLQTYEDNNSPFLLLSPMRFHQNKTGNCLADCRLFPYGNKNNRHIYPPDLLMLSGTIHADQNSD